MKRLIALLVMVAVCVLTARAQTPRPVTFTIDVDRDTFRLSPLIYGTNGQSDDRDERVTARRSGGNRWTGYNWENNASNAGSDYIHHSDNYLTWTLPESVQNTPGIAITSFHDTSVAMGAYSLITLPAAGYVSRDKHGVVGVNETAPSVRWRQVKFSKDGERSAVPDTTDGFVYVDEEVGFLMNRYGGAAGERGVKGYSFDNEPALWPFTHPRIHPARTTCREVIERSIALARGVKSVDPDAEIFGPAMYGFAEYQTLQDAPDWNDYRSHGSWIDAYLVEMRKAEQSEGRRLLDVLDLHWYPEALGVDNQGNGIRIALSANSDSGVAHARMQAPRSLWDSSYAEVSWIQQFFGSIALLPRVNAAIARNYPGTRLAVTEVNYGGDHHISGGIAMADALGIFGDYGLYMSNYWGSVEGFVSAAYRIYRNYDGDGGAFGDLHVPAQTTDIERSSVHASIESGAHS